MTVSNKAIPTDYTQRIYLVFEFIDNHLEAELSLNQIAEIAFFSPFHFHRVFKYATGETLNEYVTRRRIKKAALDLLHKHEAITAIAHQYGFGDISSFSRSFKKHFGVSPTQFKRENPNRLSKIRQLHSKNGQAYPDYEKYICTIDNLKKWTAMHSKIEVRDIPELQLAGVTHVGVNVI